MTKPEFIICYERLLVIFPPYNDNDAKAKIRSDELWKRFKNEDVKTFRAACDLLIDNYSDRQFPTPAVFHDYIGRVKNPTGIRFTDEAPETTVDAERIDREREFHLKCKAEYLRLSPQGKEPYRDKALQNFVSNLNKVDPENDFWMMLIDKMAIQIYRDQRKHP